MTQKDLFAETIPEWQGGKPAPKPAPGPLRHTAQSACDKILALVKLRPASSRELSEIDLNYTARTAELRQRGVPLKTVRTKDAVTGKPLVMYRLEE